MDTIRAFAYENRPSSSQRFEFASDRHGFTYANTVSTGLPRGVWTLLLTAGDVSAVDGDATVLVGEVTSPRRLWRAAELRCNMSVAVVANQHALGVESVDGTSAAVTAATVAMTWWLHGSDTQHDVQLSIPVDGTFHTVAASVVDGHHSVHADAAAIRNFRVSVAVTAPLGHSGVWQLHSCDGV
jgi:hypothetical protein